MEGNVPNSPFTGLSLNIGRSSRREAAVPTPSGAAIMSRRVDFGKGKEIVISGERRNVVEITQRQPPTARIEESEEYEDDEFDGAGNKRKRVHRHNADQIREMEYHFSISNHPDEIERRELGNRVGLSSQQVKFWFQNRRTQSRNMHERRANLTIRNEIQLLKEENNFLREAINKFICINCGFPGRGSQEHRLRIENAQLLNQLEMFKRSMDVSGLSQSPVSTTTNSSSVLGFDVSSIGGLVDKALVEFMNMANLEETVWLLNMGNGIGGRNNNENVSRFRLGNPTNGMISGERCVDVSRESVIVRADIDMLVKCFMDVNQWKDMFLGMLSKTAMIDVLNEGDVMNNKNGAIHLLFAEYQMLTPMVPMKELHFIRHCKQMGPKKWAIVDLAFNNSVEYGSIIGFRRRPSGCIIEDKSNGECKVIWLEQMECENNFIPSNYPRIVSAAFSARHWATSLQQHCERVATYMRLSSFPTNELTVDENRMVFETISERKNIMNFAHKMKVDFCEFIGMASLNPYSNAKWDEDENMDDITFSIRKNLNDPGEPIGMIICAVTTLWLPISRFVLSDYLRDASHKHEWDMLLNGKPAHNVATLAKGPNQLNSISIQGIEGNETRVLQDSSINEFETMLVYASMKRSELRSVAEGGDPRQVRMLASGFSILRDGLELRPIDRVGSGTWFGHGEGQQRGCLLTLAFQVLAHNSLVDELNVESLESVTKLVSFTLNNIKKKFKC